MKILLINNFHYQKGGSETVYFNNARLLEQAGHEVCFFSVDREENIETPFAKYFIADSSKMSKVTGLLKYFYNKEAEKNLEELILAERPDIAHAHLMWGCTAPSIFGILKKYRIPLVHTVHDYRMVCPAYTFKDGEHICEECRGKHFYKCAINRCNKGSLLMSTVMAAEMYYRNIFFNPSKNINGLIYVSNFAKMKHEEYAPRFRDIPSMVLYNCTQKQDNKVKGRGDYFLYFGRLSHEKGVEKVIEVFKNMPNIKLKVVGNGPIEPDLRQHASGCLNIEFLGFKKGEELHDLVRNAQFVIVPSQWYENNPMTIVEAYSFGTPIIGSDLGGIPEIIRDDITGFVFKHDSMDSLKHKIIAASEMSNQSYFNMSGNALKFYEDNFSEKGYSEKLLEFYNLVLDNYHQ